MSTQMSTPEQQENLQEFSKIMATLPSEVFDEIFRHLKFDKRSLYSCLLVNRFWCRKVVPLIWRRPMPYNQKKTICVDIGVFIPFFDESEVASLIKGGMTIPDQSSSEIGSIVSNYTIPDNMDINSPINAMVVSLSKMFMRCATNLKYLILNPFGGYRDIPDSKIFIEGRPGLTNLRKFKIRFNSLSVIRPEYRKNIFDLMNTLPNICTGIHHLDITRVRVSNPDVARMVGGVIKSQHQLFYCRFFRVDGDVDSLISMLRFQANNLITVVFDDTDLADVSLEPLARCIKLEALVFRKCRNINLEKWKTLINAPFKLKLLHLSDLSSDVIKAIIEKAGDNLEKIGMKIVSSNVVEGIEAIMTNCPNVTHLSINCIQPNIDTKIFVPLMSKLKLLTHLTISIWERDEILTELSNVKFEKLKYLELATNFNIKGLEVFLEKCDSPLTTIIMESINEEDLNMFKKFSREKGTLKWLGVEFTKSGEISMSHYDYLRNISNLAEGYFQVFPAKQLRKNI
ncbi:5921_t:CDS:2 [Diversispora eburnea]|uniref:5921_t:CDS:1 n=1 Tax=Diversispora eburnea TaxID=1213867 RepID=A0A9N8VIX1_9GLOM|nr:5921_t:CDS:2 [Diversispora eburnea]